MEFLIFLMLIALFFYVTSLRGRIKRLERTLKSDSFARAPEPGVRKSEDALSSPVSERKTVPEPAVTADVGQNLKDPHEKSEFEEALLADNKIDVDYWFNRFINWVKEDWLLKLGALLLLIGFGWLATYAFMNNWIGPIGRISLGIVAGTLFLIFGWFRIKRFLHQGGVFLVLGSTTILLTLFAAREIYDFFTPASALAIMFLSAAFVAFASVKYKSISLSLLSLIMAGIAPLLTNTPAPDYIGLFSYLLAVSLGAIWIVALTDRKELTVVALLMIFFYSSPHLFSRFGSEKEILLLFAYAFAALFFITNILGILKSKVKNMLPDMLIAGGNGLLLLAWILTAAPEEWKSLIIAAWMTVFTAGAFMIFKKTAERKPFYIYAGVGIAMLAAATAAELEGAALTIALTIECGVIALSAWFFIKDLKVALRSCLLLIGPMFLSLRSLDAYFWRSEVFNEHFFVLLVLSLVMLGLGMFFRTYIKDDMDDNAPKLINGILLIIGSIYVYALIWLSLHAALPEMEDIAVMISLVIYTIVGLIAYFYSLAREKRALKIYGGLLLGFVIFRLLAIDVWKMELSGRIVTFFIIGALLIGTAFIGKKKHSA